jgi:cation transport ATPase-like protein
VPDAVDLTAVPLPRALTELDSSPRGLTSAQAQSRLQQYGPNEIPEQHRNPILAFLGEPVFMGLGATNVMVHWWMWLCWKGLAADREVGDTVDTAFPSQPYLPTGPIRLPGGAIYGIFTVERREVWSAVAPPVTTHPTDLGVPKWRCNGHSVGLTGAKKR